MSDTRYRDAEWLHQQYHEKELTQQEIADKCGVADNTVTRWMEKHDVEARDRTEYIEPNDVRYKDAEWLHDQYHEHELSQKEIADKCDVAQSTIHDWMDKYDIQKRDKSECFQFDDMRYRDAEWLHEQYHDNGLALEEIADKCDVSDSTVRYWMNKHDIERRGYGYSNRRTGVGIADHSGYQRWACSLTDDSVAVHRLLAVAEHGFEEVCDMDVHHKNGIRWDNRPDNIELLTPSEHRSYHALERNDIDDTRYRDAEWLHEHYHENGLSTCEIADKCDVSYQSVRYWMEKHGIERRDPSHHLRSDKPTGQLTLDDTRNLEGAQTVNQ